MQRKKTAIISVFLIVLVAAVATFYMLHSSSQTARSSAGQAITLSITSRTTIDLPDAGYDKNTLTISPDGLLGETFGAGSAEGRWTRTFEAVATGTAVIRVPARTHSGYSDYIQTIHIVENSSANK